MPMSPLNIAGNSLLSGGQHNMVV